jgi:hypothetical protein
MTDSSADPTPPDGLPDGVAAELTHLSPDQLRNVIVYAQELLQAGEETGPPIEAGPNEDILRMDEQDGYTEVVKQTRCGEGCEDCPHGPYLYHVTRERLPDDSENIHWTFIGRVEE